MRLRRKYNKENVSSRKKKEIKKQTKRKIKETNENEIRGFQKCQRK